MATAKFALYAHLKAKPGKAAELEAFLKSALPLAEKEPGTITWYAFQEQGDSYGIYDTFETEAAAASASRWAHRQGAYGQGKRTAGRGADDPQDRCAGGENSHFVVSDAIASSRGVGTAADQAEIDQNSDDKNDEINSIELAAGVDGKRVGQRGYRHEEKTEEWPKACLVSVLEIIAEEPDQHNDDAREEDGKATEEAGHSCIVTNGWSGRT